MLSKIINSYTSLFKNINYETALILFTIFINASGQLFLILSSLYFSSLSFSIYQIGTIIAVYNLGTLVGSLIGSEGSEKYGIKVMQVSLLMSVVTMLMMLVVQKYYLKIFTVFFLGFSHGAFKPASIYCLTHTGGNNLSLLSTRRVVVNLGMSFATIIGAFLSKISYNLVFILESVASFIAFLFLSQYINKNKILNRISIESKKTLNNIELKFSPKVIRLYSVLFLQVIIFSQLFTTYPLFIKNEYNIDVSLYGTIFTVNALIILLFEIPVSHYISNFNKIKIAKLGILFFGFSFVIIPQISNITFLLLDAVFWTLGEILFFAVILNLIIEINPQKKGRLIGLFQFIYSIGMLCGPLIGVTIYSFNPELVWYMCFLLSAICIFII